MPGTRDVAVERLLETLAAARNPDGGWGYGPERASRLEPTCWALLALCDADGEPPREPLAAGLSLLARWQRPGGLLADLPSSPANLAFNGLAALVICRVEERQPARMIGHDRLEPDLLEGIRATKGVQAQARDYQRQDNRLQGWPWTVSTFSWVEPTAYCLLALKKARHLLPQRRGDARIAEADRLLADRCCEAGGWNYGNSNVFGKELPPYVPTTALGLLALHDRRSLPEVSRSLGWLRQHASAEASAMALSCALMALGVYREPVEPLDAALRGMVRPAGFFGNLAAAGMVLYALTASQHDIVALTV